MDSWPTVIRPLCIPGVPPADAVSVPLAEAIRRDPDEGIPVVRSCERTRRPQWHANSSDQAEDVNVMRVDLLTIDLGGHLRTRRRDDAAVGLLRSGRKATYPRRSGKMSKRRASSLKLPPCAVGVESLRLFPLLLIHLLLPRSYGPGAVPTSPARCGCRQTPSRTWLLFGVLPFCAKDCPQLMAWWYADGRDVVGDRQRDGRGCCGKRHQVHAGLTIAGLDVEQPEKTVTNRELIV